MYTSAILNPVTLEMEPSDPELDVDMGNYLAFTRLKNANLKTMLSLGGWGDSNTSDKKYSTLVSSQARIDNFVTKAVEMLIKYDFDGLDIDWEFPAGAADRQGFTNLLRTLKNSFDSLSSRQLVLSAAVSIDPETVCFLIGLKLKQIIIVVFINAG